MLGFVILVLAFSCCVVSAVQAVPASNLVEVSVELVDYPSQPRSAKPAEYIKNLAASIKSCGQRVPAIGWRVNDRWQLGDGGCRLDAIKFAGLKTIQVMDLGKPPTPAELLMAQAAIDLHKQFLPPVDRARLWKATIDARGCTAKQLSDELGASQSQISLHLLLLSLAPDIQEMVNSGALEWTKAALIAQKEKDPARQLELATEAATMTRSALVGKLKPTVNGNGARSGKIRCPLSSGPTVTVTGNELTLDEAIEALGEALKQMKKARDTGLDAKTAQAVFKDVAKAGA